MSKFVILRTLFLFLVVKYFEQNYISHLPEGIYVIAMYKEKVIFSFSFLSMDLLFVVDPNKLNSLSLS